MQSVGSPVVSPEGKWVAVKVKPKTRLPHPVTLKQIKAEPKLAECQLVRYSRLSVAEIQPGKVLYEMEGVDEAVAREALTLAAAKLSVRTTFVKRGLAA